MNVINIMNFVRACDERYENAEEILFETTKRELELVNELKIENTFLLQYDVLCDKRYMKLFREKATQLSEFGVWLEVVEPLTTACGLPYRSEHGWKWDWHIIPGLPMGYIPAERAMLIDEIMRKFKEIFGYYPKTIGGWLIDTYTMNYINERYQPEAFCICRDQVSTDAYTLVGGYFNGAYFPSTKNIFTPAQSEEYQAKTPVFRLLGPCPLFNYDRQKFIPEVYRNADVEYTAYTLEPVWYSGKTEKCVDYFFNTFFENKNLGFSAVQLGQENSFGTYTDFIDALRMQWTKAKALEKAGKISIQKYERSGRLFKRLYQKTPVGTVVSAKSWADTDMQSVYYCSQNYVANLFRNGKEVFLRGLYLFDERIPDKYIQSSCETFDAQYENLPIVDTVRWQENNSHGIGIVLDTDGRNIQVENLNDDSIKAVWGKKSILFYPNHITVNGCDILSFDPGNATADISLKENKTLSYTYQGTEYSLETQNCTIEKTDAGFTFKGTTITLVPHKS